LTHEMARVDETIGYKKVFLKAVDEGLSALGEGIAQAIYYHIEKKHGIKREQILDRPEVFHRALGSLFGSGAIVVEKLISKGLCTTVGISYEEHEDWSLVDFVKFAKKIVRGEGRRKA